MKVTDVKTFVTDCFRTNWVFVKVYTDAGIDGVGEATLEYKERRLSEQSSIFANTCSGKTRRRSRIIGIPFTATRIGAAARCLCRHCRRWNARCGIF